MNEKNNLTDSLRWMNVWDEVINANGERKTARMRTANSYSLTVTGSLAVVDYLMNHRPDGGTYTPAKLIGTELLMRLPESGTLEIVWFKVNVFSFEFALYI